MEGEASRSAALGHVARWPPFFQNGHLGLGILNWFPRVVELFSVETTKGQSSRGFKGHFDARVVQIGQKNDYLTGKFAIQTQNICFYFSYIIMTRPKVRYSMYLLSNDTKLLIPAFVSFRGFEDKYRRPTVFCVHPGVSNMAAPSRYVQRFQNRAY